jgi:hypothetical protein
MANYYAWNQAIYQYITAGLPPGSRVFLSIDNEALVNAGRLLNPSLPRSERVADFLRAVRARYVFGNRVDNIIPLGDESNKVPSYLSFLAATVLAAYRMAESEVVSSNNYFTRLKEILPFSGDDRRPGGFDAGIEDFLWQHWANWLTQRGYLPSAEAGEGGWKYINYPISQTLLRQADRETLWRHFTDRHWSRSLDEGVVVARVLREKQYFGSHLRQLLSDQTMRQARQQGLHQVIYDVYDLWANSGAGGKGDYQTVVNADQARNLVAGLYRTFNPILGEPRYALFPQQARRLQVERAQVIHDGESFDLTPVRSGWYQPLWDVSTADLDQGLKITIEGAEELDKLVLPRRDFWILTPDPDDPDAGIYASWGKPAIGVPFTILCKPALQAQIEQLKAQGLIRWQADPLPVLDGESWLEYEDVMVVSDGWGAVIFENDDLLESLQPAGSVGISLSGGIRSGLGGWLVGYGPEVTINAFDDCSDLVVVDPLSERELVVRQDVKSNEPFKLEWPPKAGSYLLRVAAGTGKAERSVMLHDWESLSPTVPSSFPQILVTTKAIFGALIGAENE